MRSLPALAPLPRLCRAGRGLRVLTGALRYPFRRRRASDAEPVATHLRAIDASAAGTTAAEPTAAPPQPSPGYTLVVVGRADDPAAVRTKIEQTAGSPIVLRVHRRNRWLGSELGMRLLERHAEAAGLRLIIESRSGKVRGQAHRHGFVAVRSMRGRRVQGNRVLPRYVRVGPVHMPLPAFGLLVRVGTIVTLVLAALIVAALLAPSTTVTIAPRLRTVSVALAVEARVTPGRAVPADGILPAQRFQVSVAATDAASTTGFVDVPDTAASSVVRFVNTTAVAIDLPAGTEVATVEGIIFRTQKAVTVPGGVGETASVAVGAVEPGLGGNVAAVAIVVPPPDLAGRLTVTNPNAARGGTARTERGAGPVDIDRLRATSEQILLNRGLALLQQHAEGRFAFHPDSAEVDVLEEQFIPPLGEAGDIVELVTTATVSVVGVVLDDLRDLALREIRRTEGSGFEIVRESLTPRDLGAATYDPVSETLHFEMTMDGQLAATVVEEAVKQAVRGKRPGRAELLLNERLTLREPAQVRVTPGWMPLTSPFGFRITVKVQTAPPEAPAPAGEG